MGDPPGMVGKVGAGKQGKARGRMRASTHADAGRGAAGFWKDTSAARRQCTPQAAPWTPPAPLAGEPFAWGRERGRVCARSRGEMLASTPVDAGAGCCRAWKGSSATRRQCTPQAAPWAPPVPLAGEPFACAFCVGRERGRVLRQVQGEMMASTPADAGRGAAGLGRILPPQSGNAPLRRRLGRRQLPLQGSLLCAPFV